MRHILEHDFFCLGHLDSSGLNQFAFFFAIFEGVFSTFHGEICILLNIVASAQKSCSVVERGVY